MRGSRWIVPVMLALPATLAACGASAESSSSHESARELVGLFADVCFQKVENVDAISEYANSRGWETADPTRLPAKDALRAKTASSEAQMISTERTSAWTIDIMGREAIAATKVAQKFGHPSCEVMMHGNENEKTEIGELINAEILKLGGGNSVKAHPRRLPAQFPEIETRMYKVGASKGALFYSMNSEDGTVVHHIIQYGERQL